MSLEGKVAIVTGASRGIGRAIALELAGMGASVACVATTQSNAESTALLIREQGGAAAAFGCDNGQSAAVEACYGQITDQLGPAAILVNNAGLTRDTLMMRMKDEDWDRVIEVNLKGAFLWIRAAQRAMMKARWGRIVNISSVIGLTGAAGQVNYAASKAGIIGMTKAVAKELGARGITCNAIAPGFIETDMTTDLSAEFKEYVVKTAPIGRLGTGEDVAHAAGFLVSEAASYITGQTLTVDGGLTL